MIVVDYETFPINNFRPYYPPKPVGVATKWGDEPGRYYSGDAAREELRRVWASGQPLIFHNAPFDLAVAIERDMMEPLPWTRVHDTQILAFLNNPYESSLGLKPLAAMYLGMPNEDVSDLHAWIFANKGAIEREYGGKVTTKTVGAYICAVPEPIRRRYAIGDVERTYRLFNYLHPRVIDAGMRSAYIRELQLMPILMANARRGLYVNQEALATDIAHYSVALEATDRWLRERLDAAELNLDSNAELIDALLRANEVREADLPKTPTGKIKADKEALHPAKFRTAETAYAIGYRNRLSTCLNTFMRPWFEQSQYWGGRISTQWHQTRGEGGTRTGRIASSAHNFLNLPKSFDDRDDGYKHPTFLGVPPLPLCRKYIKADPGHVFLHRDFDGQELRVFAHFENGDLLAQYRKNPKLDVHSYIKSVCDRLSGRDLDRTKVKILNFTALYGGGLPAIAARLRISKLEAMEFRRIHNRALPGRVILNEEIVRIIRRGGKIRTWGGRLYGMPPGAPGEDNSYMLLNYLVQGSSADLTKEAIIDWDGRRGRHSRLLTTVYDEINISAPEDEASTEMGVLKEAMEADRIRTPMISKGKIGPTWGELTPTGNGGYD
jgi:DNA polymerase I-like protein with 3'-5' exonuclease and polymerase domains